jgi:putative hemolysin
MLSIGYELSIIAVLIFFNGLLAMTEMAVVSSRKARLQQRINEGDEKARLALQVSNEPGDFLSTVQIGITLIGILAGAFGGATLASSLASLLSGFPVLAPFSTTIAFVSVVLLITYFSLIFGELVPKRLALSNPEKFAIIMVIPIRFLSFLAAPLVRLLSFSTNAVLRLLGGSASLEPTVTEEEIIVMIEQGTQAGVFEEAEQDMLEGVFRLGDLKVGYLITPRTDVDWLDLRLPVEELYMRVIESEHTRFLVGDGSLDEVRGVVPAKDLLAAYLQNGTIVLQEHLREPVYVPENMPALRVLELIKDTRVPMALVLDEYGGLSGLVTVKDIVEAVFGNLWLEDKVDKPEFVRREDGSWLLDGMLNINELTKILHVKDFPGEKQGHFQTLGGFIITYLGRIPAAAEFFEWRGMRFEIVDMDGLRVDKVLVTQVPSGKEKQASE